MIKDWLIGVLVVVAVFCVLGLIVCQREDKIALEVRDNLTVRIQLDVWERP